MEYTHEQLLTDVEIVNRELDRCDVGYRYTAVKLENHVVALDRLRNHTPHNKANMLDGSLANICVGVAERCSKLMYMDAFYCMSQVLQRTGDE